MSHGAGMSINMAVTLSQFVAAGHFGTKLGLFLSFFVQLFLKMELQSGCGLLVQKQEKDFKTAKLVHTWCNQSTEGDELPSF